MSEFYFVWVEYVQEPPWYPAQTGQSPLSTFAFETQLVRKIFESIFVQMKEVTIKIRIHSIVLFPKFQCYRHKGLNFISRCFLFLPTHWGAIRICPDNEGRKESPFELSPATPTPSTPTTSATPCTTNRGKPLFHWFYTPTGRITGAKELVSHTE